jgi:pimeloyl-ACP methyl ester carboxylesterase
MSLSFSTHGTGPVRVLCAHSWVASGVSFAPMLAHLDPDEMTWVFPDFRGYGASAPTADAVSIAGMGQDLIAVADQLGWESFHLLGHSMGGQAVQAVLGDWKLRDRAITATLVSAVPSQGSPLNSESEKLFLSAASTPSTMQGVVNTLAGGHRSAGFSHYVTALSQATSDETTLRKYLRAWTLDDVSKGVDEYINPVLVLSGELDPVLGPPVASQIASQFTNVEHIIIPDTGHFPPLESPAEVAEAVTRHVLAGQ